MKSSLIMCFFLHQFSNLKAHIFTFGPCLLQYLEPCTSNTIQFYLFTSDQPNNAPILLENDDPQLPNGFNLDYAMKIIVHGYAGNLDFNATKSIRNGKLILVFFYYQFF